MTAEELLYVNEDLCHYELVEGMLRSKPFDGVQHGNVSMQILSSLGTYLRAHDLGTLVGPNTGFILARNPDTVLAPDGAFVRREREVHTPEYFPGAPDLAFETLSPWDDFAAVVAKTRDYLPAGCKAVVIVDPGTRGVQVHRASGVTDVTDTLVVDDILPGWSMTLDELFA
jgi:Uma2 family endonuclease